MYYRKTGEKYFEEVWKIKGVLIFLIFHNFKITTQNFVIQLPLEKGKKDLNTTTEYY